MTELLLLSQTGNRVLVHQVHLKENDLGFRAVLYISKAQSIKTML